RLRGPAGTVRGRLHRYGGQRAAADRDRGRVRTGDKEACTAAVVSLTPASFSPGGPEGPSLESLHFSDGGPHVRLSRTLPKHAPVRKTRRECPASAGPTSRPFAFQLRL